MKKNIFIIILIGFGIILNSCNENKKDSNSSSDSNTIEIENDEGDAENIKYSLKGKSPKEGSVIDLSAYKKEINQEVGIVESCNYDGVSTRLRYKINPNSSMVKFVYVRNEKAANKLSENLKQGDIVLISFAMNEAGDDLIYRDNTFEITKVERVNPIYINE